MRKGPHAYCTPTPDYHADDSRRNGPARSLPWGAVSLVDLKGLGDAIDAAADALGKLGDGVAHLIALGDKRFNILSARSTRKTLIIPARGRTTVHPAVGPQGAPSSFMVAQPSKPHRVGSKIFRGDRSSRLTSRPCFIGEPGGLFLEGCKQACDGTREPPSCYGNAAVRQKMGPVSGPPRIGAADTAVAASNDTARSNETPGFHA
jgi:hypothetical protein